MYSEEFVIDKREDLNVQDVINQISEAFFALDAEWRFTYMNALACQFLCHDAASLIGKCIWNEFRKLVGTTFEAQYRKAMKERAIVQFKEYFSPLKKWFEVRVYPSPCGLNVYFQDISSAKRMERDIQRANHIFTHAQRIADMGVWEWDIPRDTIFWSDGACRIGQQPGTTGSFELFINGLVYECDRELVSKAVQDALGGLPYDVEYRMIRQDGQVRVIHSQGEVFFDDAGAPIWMIGIAQDITKRKETECLLRESRERYQSLKKYNPDGICSLDFTGNLLGVNPSLEQLVGYTEAELLKMSFFDLAFSEDTKSLRSFFFTPCLPEVSAKIECRLKCLDGHQIDVFCTRVPIVVNGTMQGLYAVIQDITEQKQVEMNLMEAEARYRLIAENAQDIISYSTPDGIFEYVSPAIHRLLGYQVEEVVGKSNLFLYHPDDISNLQAISEKVIHGENIDRFECRVRHKNGQYLWFETTIRMIRDEVGKIMHILGVGRDVTERKRAEENLRKSKNNLVHAQQIAHLGHWDIDIPTGEVYLSLEMLRICGINREDFDRTYKGFLNLIHPDDRHSLQQILKSTVEGKTFEVEFRIVRPDKTCRILHSLGDSEFDRSGHPLRIFGTIQDITERKLAELHLKESEERYRVLIENSLDAIAVNDGEQWLYINEAGLKMFEASKSDDVIGKPIHNFLHPDFHEICEKQTQNIVNDKLPAELIEEKWYTLTGKLIETEVLAVPVMFQNQAAVQLIIRDISERKQSEQLLIQSEKLSAIGQLAAGVAHEIRNPLTSIKGFVQLLRSTCIGAKPEYFDIMEHELSRIEMISSEMLMLAKPQAISLQARDIHSILQSVVTLLDTQAVMKNIHIVTEYENVSKVMCSENQIKQVFINLIKNAIEAMTDGGKVTIRLKEVKDKVIVQFEDQGCGISEELLGKLGEPFLTTKQNGTGLGIMVTRKIIENHHGRIDYASQIGLGTTVTVTLPVSCQNEVALA